MGFNGPPPLIGKVLLGSGNPPPPILPESMITFGPSVVGVASTFLSPWAQEFSKIIAIKLSVMYITFILFIFMQFTTVFSFILKQF